MKQAFVLILEPLHLHHGLLQLAPLAIQFQENTDFGFQYFLVDRLEQIVHRATFVALEDIFLFFGDRRNENDRNVAGLLVLAHEFCHFEPIHLRHLHIKQNQREIVLQGEGQGLIARLGHDQITAISIQDRFQRDQVFPVIIHNQNVLSHRLTTLQPVPPKRARLPQDRVPWKSHLLLLPLRALRVLPSSPVTGRWCIRLYGVYIPCLRRRLHWPP